MSALQTCYYNSASQCSFLLCMFNNSRNLAFLSFTFKTLTEYCFFTMNKQCVPFVSHVYFCPRQFNVSVVWLWITEMSNLHFSSFSSLDHLFHLLSLLCLSYLCCFVICALFWRNSAFSLRFSSVSILKFFVFEYTVGWTCNYFHETYLDTLSAIWNL